MTDEATYWFLMAAVTNDDKPSGLEQPCYYLIVLRSEVQNNGSTGAKARCWQSCVPSTDSRGESVPLPFPASRRLLNSLACGTSFIFKANSFAYSAHSLGPWFLTTSSSLTSTHLPPFYKDPCGYTKPSEIIQDNLPLLKILNLNHTRRVPFAT